MKTIYLRLQSFVYTKLWERSVDKYGIFHIKSRKYFDKIIGIQIALSTHALTKKERKQRRK